MLTFFVQLFCYVCVIGTGVNSHEQNFQTKICVRAIAFLNFKKWMIKLLDFQIFAT